MAINVSQSHAPATDEAGTAVFLMGISAIIGMIGAALVLPVLLPPLSQSLGGIEVKAFWYVSRASALVSFVLLWLSMAIGLAMTNKMARVWPGGPAAFDLHQFTSLLGLGFAAFHGLILMGDQYLTMGLREILIPFASADYRPFWVGLGQIAIYLMTIVAASFAFRRQLSHRLWRLIHFLSFLIFIMALGHGIFSGSDSGTPLVTLVYWVSGATVLFLTAYRVIAARSLQRPNAATSRPARSQS